MKLRFFLSVSLLVALLAAGFSLLASAFGPQAAALLFLSLLLVPQGLAASAKCGVNAVGSLYGALILQEALSLTFRQRPELKLLALGFKDLDGKAEAALLNQPVTSRVKAVAQVNDFGTGATDRADTDVTLTLTQQKEVQHAFTPTEYNSTNRDLIAESAAPIARALANHIIDSVRDIWIENNFPNSDGLHTPVTVGSAWNRANTTRALRLAANKAGIPRDQARFQVFNADVYDSLLGDQNIVYAMYNADAQSAIKTGQLPQVDGFGIAEYPDLTINVGVAQTVASIIAATDLLTVSAGHNLVTGQRVKVTFAGGAAGLTSGSKYYVIRISATTFKVATTAANAAAGTAIDITTDGTGAMAVQDMRIGFAGTPDATVYLARPMKNPTEVLPGVPFPGFSGYIEDPVTGFKVLATQWIDQNTLKANTRISWLQGYGVGNKNNGLLLYQE